jgi:O-antigen/teichoic acid export membrane protein
MPLSKKKPTLAAHYLRYVSANVLVLVAGLISFPITTRLLSNAEFGILSYWETTLLLTIAVLKLGAGESLMRFYPHGADANGLARYETSLIAFPALLTGAAWCVLMAGMGLLWYTGWLETPAVALLAMAQALPAVWGAMALRVLQAREQSGLNSMVLVLWRWVTVAATLGMLLFVLPSATGVLLGRLLANIGVVAVLVMWLMRSLHVSRAAFDGQQAAEGIRFGMPIAVMEISTILMWSVDRLMLKWLLNDFSLLGIYSIGMALASYIDQLVSTALTQALGPVINRVYTLEGAAGVRRLKARVLRPLIYASTSLCAGLVIAGRDFLSLLASTDKSAAAPIFILAGSAFLLRPILSLMSEGLLLQKRSRLVSSLTVGVAVCGMSANLWLIPHFGILGATATVCCSVIGLQLLFMTFCPGSLRYWPPLGLVLRAVGCGMLAIGIALQTDMLGIVGPLYRLMMATMLILLCCVVPAVTFDGEVKALALRGWRKLSQRGGSAT